MVNSSTAIIPYRPPADHFIVREMRGWENPPALGVVTSGTSLVPYEKRLPERYFIRGPIIEVAMPEGLGFGCDLPEGREDSGYNPQGHLTFQGKKGLRIDTYI